MKSTHNDQNVTLTRSLSILRDLKENVFRCKCCRSKFSFLRPHRTCMVCSNLVCQSCSKNRWNKERIPEKNLREAKTKRNYRVCNDCVTNNPKMLLEQFKRNQDDHVLSLYHTKPVARTPILQNNDKSVEETECKSKSPAPHPMLKYFYDPSKDESKRFSWNYNPGALSGVCRNAGGASPSSAECNYVSTPSSSSFKSPYHFESPPCTSIQMSPKLRSQSSHIRSYYGRGAMAN